MSYYNTICKSVWIHGIYYSWSKSVDSTEVRNESRCFMVRSCLLAGQCPAFVAFFFITCLFDSSRGQWYRRWSIVWSPCSQAHVAFSRILNRWKYALVFPCPVIIATIYCVTLILVVNFSWTVGNYCLVFAALVHVRGMGTAYCVWIGLNWTVTSPLTIISYLLISFHPIFPTMV